MTFNLYLDEHNRILVRKLPTAWPLLAQRDPDVPIEWKPGFYYFNPLHQHKVVYIYRGDNELINMTNNLKLAHRNRAQLERTWFELLPQPIYWNELAPELRSMIESLPANRELISRAFLRYHSIRLPAEVGCQTETEWRAWIETGLRVPMTPRIKQAFLIQPPRIVISKEDAHEFQTGEVMPPMAEVRIKAFQVRQVVRVVKQLAEHPVVEFDLPLEILSQGYEAIKRWAMEDPLRWDRLNTLDPVAEEVASERIEEISPVEIACWQKLNNGWVKVCGEDSRSANDAIREILEQQN